VEDFAEAIRFAARIFEVPEVSVVRAAGAIPVRRSNGSLEVGLIHRPAYRDWSFPKGKVADGESLAQAALRELSEEIGFGGRLGRPLGCTAYIDPRGRPKIACYYVVEMTALGQFRPGEEVDEFIWVGLQSAGARLTSAGDRVLLAASSLDPPSPAAAIR
jgi:8-oxo-dGTP diphosphatase